MVVLTLIDMFSRAVAGLAMILVVALIGSMFYEVVARYGLNNPTVWAYDVSYMLNGVIFLLGAGFVLMKNLHVRVDFLSTRLPVRLQHTINLVFDIFVLLPALVWVSYRAVTEAWDSFVTGAVEVVSPWAPVIWPFEGGIALGLVALTLQLIATIVRHGMGLADPASVPSPAENEAH